MVRSVGVADMVAFASLLRCLNKIKPDIVHSHSSKAGALARLCIGPWKQVYTPHAVYTLNPYLPRAQRRFYGLIERLLGCVRSDRIIAVSVDEANHLHKVLRIPSDRIETIFNGVPASALLSSVEARRALGLPPDSVVVGFVGRLDFQKGVDRLVRVAQSLLDRGIENVVFAAIGPGDFVAASGLNERAIPRNLRVLGPIPNAHRYFSAFDIFALPSRYEGFPYVVLEAMAAHIPIVSARVSGAAELIDAEQIGFVVPNEDDIDSFATATAALAQDPDMRERMSSNCARAVKRFSTDTMIDRTADLYRRLLKRRPVARHTHVVLLHAYSSRNSGDGLLVDLSVNLLKSAFGELTRVSIIAADPASFPQYRDVYPAPVLADSGLTRVAGAAALVLPIASNSRVRQLLEIMDSADLIVGVGGGYLRARNWKEAIKLEAGHLLQMRAASLSGKPVVYLPQSIGPAMSAGPLRSHLAGMLKRFSAVFVRDDRSAALLADNANAHRAPDLAVLDFERRRIEIMARAAKASMKVAHVAFVLRRAPSWTASQRTRYEAETRRLIQRLGQTCRVSFAVQSTGRGNDDLAYYRSIGISGDLLSLKELLNVDRPDVVVSVRLHGSLESVLNGVPSYHLSYERKGFGAYSDLGLDDWVANAADFDADEVAGTILAQGAIRDFWASASTGFERIRADRDRILAALRTSLSA
jgi:glycosyltransferase involved in cell wall biosynthesis/polysaccharide pyruvyl transferase WcaK-like protein